MSEQTHKNFISQLFMLLKTAQIHEPGNRAFQQPFEQFQNFLSHLLEEEGVVAIELIEMSLYFNDSKIRSDIALFGLLRFFDDLFVKKEIGGFRFVKLPSAEELVAFLKLLNSKDSHEGVDALNEKLTSKDFHAVEFLKKSDKRMAAKQDGTRPVDAKRRALKNYVKAIDVFRNVTSGKQTGTAVETRKAKRIVYDLVDICLDEGFSFVGLASIKNYDEYTFNHSVNVCVLSISFGKNLGLSKRQLGELGIAGLYHDYGKTLIPLEILNKPAKFSPEEWEVMKTHPLMSIKKLLSMKGGFQPLDIKKMIAAFEHHRNYDCTGYPQTGVSKKLNFYSRVVAIADAYDAMTTNRVYQRGMLPTIALKILIEHSGTKFDPLLVKAFVNTVGIYPVGSLVKMNNGQLGVVSQVSKVPEELARPTVRIVTNAQGAQIETGPEINLADENAAQGLFIDNVVRPEDHGINVAHFLFGDAKN